MRADSRGFRAVGDHDHGPPLARVQIPEDAQNLRRERRVEVAGRLVGQDHLRVIAEGPRHGDTLLLADREFARQVVHPVGESQADRAGPSPATHGRRFRWRRSDIGTMTFSYAER